MNKDYETFENKVVESEEQVNTDISREKINKLVSNILIDICEYLALHSDISSIQDTVIKARMCELTKLNFSNKIETSVLTFLEDVIDYSEKHKLMSIEFSNSLDTNLDYYIYEKANDNINYFYPAIIDGWLNYDYNNDTFTGLDGENFKEKIIEYFTITIIKYTFQEFNYKYIENNKIEENKIIDDIENNDNIQSDNKTLENEFSDSLDDTYTIDCVIS